MKKHDNFLRCLGLLILFGLLVLGCDKNARRRKELKGMKSNYTFEQPVSSDIHSIEADMKVGTILLKEGDVFMVKASYSHKQLAPEVSESDGRLMIKQSEKIKDKNLDKTVKCEVEVTCPHGMPGGKSFSNLRLFSDLGNISVQGISSESTDLQCSVGNLKVSDSSLGKTNLLAGIGNISVENGRYISLTVETETGNQIISNADFNTLDSKAELGNIRLIPLESLSEYTMDLSVSLGRITVNGEKQKSPYRTYDNGNKKISASSSTGNISID
ncbi:MAG: DUF4097 family beta strand repeat protein [Treponema sp.]|nr:DUF4097 family beta strand repeat protein [Treponema sp.]